MIHTEELWCRDCGDLFVFPADDQERTKFAARGYPPPKRCQPCRDRKFTRLDATPGTRRCIDCNGHWVLTASQLDFFINRSWRPPLRCEDCRAKRRRAADSGGPHV